ncbi:MAG: DHH family phosphoesterase [Candidatus Woesearchaeota archaeon]
MLSDKEIKQIREELESCKRPIFFFHDDQDGLASFLLLYRYIKEGRGVVLKAFPELKAQFAKKAIDYGADKVFILDIALVEQNFIDNVKRKIVWVDHHEPLERERVDYYNPRIQNAAENIPVSALCYKVVQQEQDLWLATIGSVADWYMPDFAKAFSKRYPDLLPREIKEPETAIFTTQLGKLIRIFSFILKGKTSEVMRCVKILTRIKTPYEILNGETPAGRYILKKFEKINEEYEHLIKRAEKTKPTGKLLFFSYTHESIAFSKDISNELLHKNPDKIVIVARDRKDEMKCSLRAKVPILPALKKALQGIDGFGGGHEFACGVNIKKDDFKRFLENFKSELGI